MVNTIKNVKITIIAMYSTQSPPFSRESKQPPPFPYQTIISNVFLVFKWAVLRKNLFAGFTLQSFCVTIIWV
jgi:hypothetical protein